MNILSPDKLRACTSCQMCAAGCPVQAISIQLDEDGFYRPVVSNKCIDCELCVSVCYKYDTDIRMTSDAVLEETPLYAASAYDGNVVARTTSGGIADLLAQRLTQMGYICVGVCYDTQSKCAYDKIALSREDTIGFRGSKYIQSFTADAFRDIITYYIDRKVAVFGTPCHIYAIDKYLSDRKKRGNFILIDLYCHGCPTINLWHKYIGELNACLQLKPDFVSFRSKVNGWGKYCVSTETEGRVTYVSQSYKDKFYTLFFSDHLLNNACSECRLRGTLAYTDIRLGDFWGRCYDLDCRGVSAVSVVTEAGRSLFKSLQNEMKIKRHCYTEFLPYQSWRKKYHPDTVLRSALLKQMADSQTPLSLSVNYYLSRQPIGQKAQRQLKSLILSLPDGWIVQLKKIYHKWAFRL